MIVPTLFLVVSVLNLLQVSGESTDPEIGPLKRIENLDIHQCDGYDLLEITPTKDGRGFNAKLKLPSSFNSKWTFEHNLSKWNGTQYEHVVSTQGSICETAHNFFPTFIKRVYALGNIRGDCPIKKKRGDYYFKGIRWTNKDLINVPAVLYGTLMSDVLIFDAQKNQVGCFVVNYESPAV